MELYKFYCHHFESSHVISILLVNYKFSSDILLASKLKILSEDQDCKLRSLPQE